MWDADRTVTLPLLILLIIYLLKTLFFVFCKCYLSGSSRPILMKLGQWYSCRARIYFYSVFEKSLPKQILNGYKHKTCCVYLATLHFNAVRDGHYNVLVCWVNYRSGWLCVKQIFLNFWHAAFFLHTVELFLLIFAF